MKEINVKNFDLVENSKIPVLILMSALWCLPCKSTHLILEEILKEYKDKVDIFSCDVDENHQLAEKYGIRNIPTILYFKNGRVVDKQVGAGMKIIFTNKLQPLLS